jgi:acyl-CoA synthetase (AMP-forming)/AMP-acid ligase II
MNLVEVLLDQCRRKPDASAIIETRHGHDATTTFTGLERRSSQVAALLRRNGIKAGDPVLIFHPMSAELYAILLGVFRLGAVAMFLDPSAGRAHIERCCELQTPSALIASPKAHLLRLTSAALRRIRRKFVVGRWVPGASSLANAQNEPPINDCESCDAETPALLTFTSGSTGLPKAAVRTHGFLLAQHQVLHHRLKLAEGEVDLTTLPIFLLANLASGLTSVIPQGDLRSPGAVEPAPVLSQIERHHVTRCAASPAFFERLLASPLESRKKIALLRKIHTGGAPVFPRLLEALSSVAPDAKIEAVYGSTEAEPIAHLDARHITAADRSAMRGGQGLLTGLPIPEIHLRVIPDQWGRAIGPFTVAEFAHMRCSTMQVGEIVVAGDHVLKGYLHRRDDEESKFQVGDEVWHRTGDAGKIDAQGRLWLVGRCSAKIRDAHGEIYPFAVECVAMEHPGIRRAAFVAHAGQRLLVIESKPEFDQAAMQTLRKDLLWSSVDKIRILGRLPVDKRHNAKIDYPTLQRLLDKSPKSNPE